MVKGNVVWLSVLILSSALGQPLSRQQYLPPYLSPCHDDPCAPTPCNPCTLTPCDPCMESSDPNNVVQLELCNPNVPPVNYVYGRAPLGSVLVKPGQIRFRTPPPIVVKPVTIALPKPPVLWIKPVAIQPPTPDPISVKPPPVQPPTPPAFYVRVPPMTLPQPAPMLIKPAPVKVPKPPAIKVQPAAVQVPDPENLLVKPSRIAVQGAPMICFCPNSPVLFRTVGCATVTNAGRPDRNVPTPILVSSPNPCDPCKKAYSPCDPFTKAYNPCDPCESVDPCATLNDLSV